MRKAKITLAGSLRVCYNIYIIMKPSKAVIECAIENANLSTARFRVGAVVFYKGSIEGEGFNQALKTHPKSPHPYKAIDAEFAAVIDAVRGSYEPDNLKHCGIYIHRLKRDGTSGLAKPCSFCRQMLHWIGIAPKDIYYSE